LNPVTLCTTSEPLALYKAKKAKGEGRN
jgi:hypothetical protein